MTSKTGNLDSRSLVYEKYWMKLYEEQHTLSNENTFEFIIVDAPNWVQLVPLTDEGKFVMIRQYRPAWRRESLEFPGGRVEEDEDLQSAAKRELREETGYDAGNMQFLLCSNPVSWTTQEMSLFLADDLTQVGQELDEQEDIEVVEIDPTDIPKLIQAGAIRQSTSILAYNMWLLHQSVDSAKEK